MHFFFKIVSYWNSILNVNLKYVNHCEIMSLQACEPDRGTKDVISYNEYTIYSPKTALAEPNYEFTTPQ